MNNHNPFGSDTLTEQLNSVFFVSVFQDVKGPLTQEHLVQEVMTSLTQRKKLMVKVEMLESELDQLDRKSTKSRHPSGSQPVKAEPAKTETFDSRLHQLITSALTQDIPTSNIPSIEQHQQQLLQQQLHQQLQQQQLQHHQKQQQQAVKHEEENSCLVRTSYSPISRPSSSSSTESAESAKVCMTVMDQIADSKQVRYQAARHSTDLTTSPDMKARAAGAEVAASGGDARARPAPDIPRQSRQEKCESWLNNSVLTPTVATSGVGSPVTSSMMVVTSHPILSDQKVRTLPNGYVASPIDAKPKRKRTQKPLTCGVPIPNKVALVDLGSQIDGGGKRLEVRIGNDVKGKPTPAVVARPSASVQQPRVDSKSALGPRSDVVTRLTTSSAVRTQVPVSVSVPALVTASAPAPTVVSAVQSAAVPAAGVQIKIKPHLGVACLGELRLL